MDLHLKGKKALVASSSRGLGFAIARGLALEGAHVAINGRDSKALEKSARELSRDSSVEILALPGDIGNPSTPQKLIDEVTSAWNGIDILVTNSGGPPSGKFETFKDLDWQLAVETLLFSHVRLIREAVPFLRASDAASVLTITSYTVKQPLADLVLSNSVRSATIGLTKTLALELGPQGIRFNSILPAWIDTARTQELDQFRARMDGTTFEEVRARKSKNTALGRIGSPEEFANAAVFLLSPAASYITGVMLTLDGGLYKGTF